MEVLLIDGVKYELWTPPSEDEFEREVKEHTKEIFGEQSIYLDLKQKLKSVSGIGSIPDGFAITLGDKPHWHIVEVELSSHPLDDHIASQVRRFITGINNWRTQQEIAKAIYDEIDRDGFLKLKVEQAIKAPEIYRFLAELISKLPILTIIIEKDTRELREVLSTIRYPEEIKVVEFQTFTREGIGLAVHAHLFEPLYKPVIPIEPSPPEIPVETMEIKVWPAYIKYGYIGIWRKFRHLFPDIGSKVELITDEGDVFQTQVGDTAGSMELWYLREWFNRNPDLKQDDLILIRPIEPMKKYRIQTKKRAE